MSESERISRLEHRVARLEAELERLRAQAGVTVEPEPEPERAPAPTMLDFVVPPATPVPPAPVVPPAAPVPAASAAAPPRVERREAPPVPVEPRKPLLEPYLDRLRAVDVSDLLGARVLAWAGGVVTLLGIVFFFVLAVNRGWIGPGVRVACGAAASGLVFAAGLWLRRRYGQVYSALTAAGAGLAGGYATLLAAAALYDLLPALAALAFAAAIAAVGAFTALRWSAQPLAGLGLIGAMVVPAIVVLEGGLSPLGTAFVAIVFAAAALVAIERNWIPLLVLSVLAGLPQVAVLVAQDDARGSASVTAVAAAFWLLFLAAATWWHERRGGEELESGPASLFVTASILAPSAAARIFDGAGEGAALLVVAGVEAALAVGLYLRSRFAGLAAVAGAGALAALAIGVADLLGGPSLTIAWAAEAALLAWLAPRVRERRFQLAALAYFGLAVGHALAFEARPEDLYVASPHPANGAPSAVALAAAAAVVALFARSWEDRARSGGVLEPLDRLVEKLAQVQAILRPAAGWAAGALAVYAASLAILELGFDGGHTGVTALWAGLGTALVGIGLLLRLPHVRFGGLALVALGLVELLQYDLGKLSPELRSLSALAAGTGASLAALLEQRLAHEPWRLRAHTVGLLGVGVAAVTGGTVELGGVVWLFAPALAYGVPWALSVVRADSRDLTGLLAAVALALAGIAASSPLSGTWLVLAYTLAGAAVAAAASLLREPRFRLAGLVFAVAALAHLLLFEARPDELFVERGPGGGIAGTLLVGGAFLALGLELRRRYATRRDDARRGSSYLEVAVALESVRLPGSIAGLWASAAAAVYAASFALLTIDFDGAQPGVTALWGAVGLACVASLWFRNALRPGGFAFLLAALAKLVAFDLGHLSGNARGLALVAVGAAWVLAGFADQRLDRRPGLTPESAALLLVGAAIVAAGTIELGGSAWLLAPAGAFGVLWAAAYAREDERDPSSLLAAIALVLAAVAAQDLLDRGWLVLAWSAAAAALAGVSAATREPRFRAGALAFLALGLGHVLVLDDRPDRLFRATAHPGAGTPALAFVVVAAAVVALELARRDGYRSLPAAIGVRLERARLLGLWSAAVLAVYTLSLAILELAQRVAPGTLDENFQRGHTGVSACWGIVGLGLLYAGLRRRSTGLRLGGFGLLGVSLAKIFLYDLANLSSVTRALSFLAVGAVLLVGGLVYQRLAGEEPPPPSTTTP